MAENSQLPYHVINGIRYPRVTSILSAIRNQNLEEWRGRVGNKEASATITKATNLGTRVHQIIQDIISGRPVPKFGTTESQVQIKNCIQAFVDYRKTYPFHNSRTEIQVRCEEPRFCGTADALLDGILIDWKTSSRISINYWLQLAAYRKALGLDIEKVRVVRLDKNLGMFEVHEKTAGELAGYLKTFVSMCEWYNEWLEINEEEGEYDYTNADGKDSSVKAVAGSEVPNDRRRKNWEI